jgi:Zn-finger nucleic acid-binding protein
MKCPVCKTIALLPSSLESNLTCRHCDQCRGNWVQSFEYWKWREQHKGSLPENNPDHSAQPANSPDPHTGALRAKLCPECNGILIRYRVGHGVSFSIDQCGNCGGVWFDKDEWESLKSRNLHDDVYTIFTAPWQKQVHSQDSLHAQEEIYRKKFGEEGFEEIKRMKEWIDEHPRKQEIIAFLMHASK